ncbi:GNAT family N-acetyltransferase [Streptomyces sp. BE147]|uniref:GNAT family N-acetyltransferase n=1 Tax=Streptomyces sp. BE147 TaxID=3002524 RepID=UPI002E784572|nr:GNAT family N-acetyltransferase [Streptomyces sp. BE147]MEE1741225.1 GNAT family N-acetyltransferase [Streptomyces sp. BE147]
MAEQKFQTPPAATKVPVIARRRNDLNEEVFELLVEGRYIGHATVADLGDVYWIDEIRVGCDHQGSGYGNLLLTAVLGAYNDGDFALSCEQFDVGLSSSALAAWYARHGFREDWHPDFEHRMIRPAADAAH